MKRSFLFFFLFVTVAVIAQTGQTTGKDRLSNTDSIQKNIANVQDSLDEANRVSDSIRAAENNIRNILALAESQDKLNDRRKKGAIIRIAIGVMLLVVLVIGLRRKRKQSTVDSTQ